MTTVTATDLAARDEAIASIRASARVLETTHGMDVWPILRHVNAALATTSTEAMIDHVRAAQDVLNAQADGIVAALR